MVSFIVRVKRTNITTTIITTNKSPSILLWLSEFFICMICGAHSLIIFRFSQMLFSHFPIFIFWCHYFYQLWDAGRKFILTPVVTSSSFFWYCSGEFPDRQYLTQYGLRTCSNPQDMLVVCFWCHLCFTSTSCRGNKGLGLSTYFLKDCKYLNHNKAVSRNSNCKKKKSKKM